MLNQVVVCDLSGTPLNSVEVSDYRFTTRLNDAGDGSFKMRSDDALSDWLAPWSGMVVVLNYSGSVLWCGVPVKRRRTTGDNTVEIAVAEWTRWLTRVSPGVLDDDSFVYGDYDEVPAGAVVSDLMNLVPQNQPGFVSSPLLPPDPASGSIVTLGEPPDTVDRSDIWDILRPLRDQGVEMYVRTSMEGSRYVPRVVVGDPKIESGQEVPFWWGSDVGKLELVEDGSRMATRWRLNGAGESLESFATGSGMLLLDSDRSYGDEFASFTAPDLDELSELQKRADRLLSTSKIPSKWFEGVELRSKFTSISPGDNVALSTPGSDVFGRVESVEYSLDSIKVDMVEPNPDTDQIPGSPNFFWAQRSQQEAVERLERRASVDRSRAKWVGSYEGISTGGPQRFVKNDMVRDGGWMMIANKPTYDRPAPVPTGDPFYAYTGSGMTSMSVEAKHVIFGNRYAFGAVSGEAIWVNGWRLWTHAGHHYEVWSVWNPGTTDEVATQVLTKDAVTDGWQDIAITPELIQPGKTLDARIVVTDNNVADSTWTARWNYTTPNNAGAPAAGDVSHANKAKGSLRVSKTDDYGADQSTALLNMTAGDSVSAAGIDWQIQSVTDQGSYVDFQVTPEAQVSVGVHDFTFHIPGVATVHYETDTDYWPTTGYQVNGLFTTGGLGDVVADDHAYGVDLLVQGVSVSADWDVMSVSSGDGSGGGGTSYVGEYRVDGVTYSEGSLVRDGDWLMQANTTTASRPGVRSNDADWVWPDPDNQSWAYYPETGTPITQCVQGVYGNRFVDTDLSLRVRSVVVKTVPEQEYQLFVRRLAAGGSNDDAVMVPLGSFKGTAGENVIVDVGGPQLSVAAENDFSVMVLTRALYDSSTDSRTSSTWIPSRTSTFTAPVSGQIVVSDDQPQWVHVHKLSIGGVTDHSVLLRSLGVGDSLSSDMWVQEAVDNGDYFSFRVLPNDLSFTSSVRLDIEKRGVTQLKSFFEDGGAINPGDGFIDTDGSVGAFGALTTTNTAYGIHCYYEAVGIHPDWDVVHATPKPSVKARSEVSVDEFPDTDWLDLSLTRGWVVDGDGAKYRLFNGVVYMMVTVKDGDTGWGTLGTLPVGFRPPYAVSHAGVNYGGASCEVKIHASGNISMGGSSATRTSFILSFPIT